jgi:hypothetical protein
VSLLSSLAIPLRGLSMVLWNPFAFAVCIAQAVLSVCVSLLGKPARFRYGLRWLRDGPLREDSRIPPAPSDEA